MAEYGTKVEDLKPNPDLERGRGTAKGVYYGGIAVTGTQGPNAPSFALIALEMDTLIDLWDQIMAPTPLNQNATYKVALFQQSDVVKEAE